MMMYPGLHNLIKTAALLVKTKATFTRQTNVGQPVLANSNRCVWTTQQHVGKLLATNRTCLYSRQLFANSLPTCCCVVHIHQFEFANISLSCEGRYEVFDLSSNPNHQTCNSQVKGPWSQGFKWIKRRRKCLVNKKILDGGITSPVLEWGNHEKEKVNSCFRVSLPDWYTRVSLETNSFIALACQAGGKTKLWANITSYYSWLQFIHFAVLFMFSL